MVEKKDIRKRIRIPVEMLNVHYSVSPVQFRLRQNGSPLLQRTSHRIIAPPANGSGDSFEQPSREHPSVPKEPVGRD